MAARRTPRYRAYLEPPAIAGAGQSCGCGDGGRGATPRSSASRVLLPWQLSAGAPTWVRIVSRTGGTDPARVGQSDPVIDADRVAAIGAVGVASSGRRIGSGERCSGPITQLPAVPCGRSSGSAQAAACGTSRHPGSRRGHRGADGPTRRWRGAGRRTVARPRRRLQNHSTKKLSASTWRKPAPTSTKNSSSQLPGPGLANSGKNHDSPLADGA